MTRFKLATLALTLAFAACTKPTATGSTDNWGADAGSLPQTQPLAPGKLGAVVPSGTNTYPRAFYNASPPSPTSGDSVNLQTDSSGNLKVAGTISATVDTSALATSAKQDTGNTSLGTIATNTPAKGTAVMTGSEPVTLATDDTLTNKLTQPTTSAAVTPSDSTVLACGKGLWIGTAGNLSLKLSGDSSAVTWKNVPSGSWTAGNVIRVMVATTAADIVCLN